MSQDFDTVKCQTYAFSFDYHFTSNPPGQSNVFYVFLAGSPGAIFSDHLSTTSDSLGQPSGLWVSSQQMSVIGSGQSASIEFLLQCYASTSSTSTVWIDNIILNPIGDIIGGSDCPYNVNLISNGDFEAATSGVPSWQPSPQGGVSQVQPGYNGSTQAVSLSCSDTTRAAIQQTVTTTESQFYQLNFVYYWYDVTEWDSVYFEASISPQYNEMFRTYGSDTAADEDYYGVSLDIWAEPSDSDGQLIFGAFSDSVTATFLLRCTSAGSSGTLYIDNISITLTTVAEA